MKEGEEVGALQKEINLKTENLVSLDDVEPEWKVGSE